MKALSLSIPAALPKNKTAYEKKYPVSTTIHTAKKNKAHQLEQQIYFFNEVIKKADALLKKIDDILLSTRQATDGFYSSITTEPDCERTTDESAAPTGTVEISLPKIVQQTGHICKPAALATLDAYYAVQHGVAAIPLRKNRKARTNLDAESPTERPTATQAQLSVRQLTKRHGSIQGEVLEAENYRHLAKTMGYSVDVLSPDDPAAFKKIVLNHLSKGQPLVTCFAVDRENGHPQSEYLDNEHACLITACDPVANTIDIVHWGQTFQHLSIVDMFDSMNILPAEREQEIYYRRDDSCSDPRFKTSTFKYEKECRQVGNSAEAERKSIIPARGSGFKNKIFSIVPDLNSPRWNAQRK